MKTTEEIQIEKTFSKENPFKVPENYFENFTEQMMRQLPTRRQQHSRRPLMWIAACFCSAVIGIGLYLHFNRTISTDQIAETQSASISTHETDLLDQAADYMMYDEHDFYAYLSEE